MLTLRDVAAALGTEVLGDADLPISGVNEPALAAPEDLALAMSPRYAAMLAEGRARAAVVWPNADWRALGLRGAVTVGRPRLAMADLTRLFDFGPGWPDGIHPSALVDPRADIAPGVAVGPFSVIGPEVRIGPDSRLGPHVTIGAGTRIGAGALIHPGVRIGPRVSIGDDFIAHANAVIGADGFSFVTEDVSLAERARATLGDSSGAEPQAWRRIHSLGGVVIGNEVEIGACSTVDFGTVRATGIGDGTKIDNHVHIAHNVIVGRHCLICAQTGIAGSTTIGDYVVLGGQTGVVDNIKVGDRVITGAGTMLLSNVPAGRVMQGYPAVRMASHVESYKALRRLPRLLARLAGAEKPVSKQEDSD